MLIPPAYRIVAYLFILSGCFAIVRVLIALTNATVRIDLDVLCLFVGFGLFRLSSGWRTFAIFYSGFCIIASVIVAVLGVPRSADILGIPVPLGLGYSLGFAFWLLEIWKVHVLISSEVEDLFDREHKLYWQSRTE